MQEHLFDVPKDGGVPLAKFFGLGAMLIATQTAQNSSKDLLEFFWQGMLKFKTYDECRALLEKFGPVSPSFTVPLDKSLLMDGLNLDQVSEEKRAPALTTKKKI